MRDLLPDHKNNIPIGGKINLFFKNCVYVVCSLMGVAQVIEPWLFSHSISLMEGRYGKRGTTENLDLYW